MSCEGWKEVNLNSFIDFKNGKKRPSHEGTYPVYGGNGILKYADDFNNNNAVVIGRVGAYCGSVFYEKNKCWVSDNAISANERDNSDVTFDYYLLKSLDLNHRHIGTSQPLLTQEILNSIVIQLPPLAEQKVIAATLSCLDDKIELNNRINKTLEDMAQAIFKNWFVDFEPFQDGEFDESELGPIPKGWSIKRLDELCSVKGGKRLPKGSNLTIEKTNHPYIRVRDLNGDQYVYLNDTFEYIDDITQLSISHYTINTDDIIISIVGTIGLISKVHYSLLGANLTENCVKLTDYKEVTSDYLYLYLTSDYGQSEIKKMTVGAVQAKLPIYNIQSIKTVVPPSDWIASFQLIVEAMDKLIEQNIIETINLTNLRNMLLPKLMNGEIRVPVEV